VPTLMRLEGPRERNAAVQCNENQHNPIHCLSLYAAGRASLQRRVALRVAMRYDRVESRCIALPSGAKRENSAARRLTRILGRTDE